MQFETGIHDDDEPVCYYRGLYNHIVIQRPRKGQRLQLHVNNIANKITPFVELSIYHLKKGLALLAAAELVAPAAPDPVADPSPLATPTTVGKVVAVGAA
jgi:hypothetical protein